MLPILQAPESKVTSIMRGLTLAAQSIPELIGQYEQKKSADRADKQIADIFLKESESNPIFKPLAEIYKNPGISHENKVLATNMVMSAQRASDPFRVGREQRLKEQTFQDRYQKAISSLERELKEAPHKNRKPLEQQRANLKKEFAANMRRLRSGQEPLFKYLEEEPLRGSEMQFGLEPFESEEGDEISPADQRQATSAKKKITFDPSNPAHIKKFSQLKKHFKGDRQKINEYLSREFD